MAAVLLMPGSAHSLVSRQRVPPGRVARGAGEEGEHAAAPRSARQRVLLRPHRPPRPIPHLHLAGTPHLRLTCALSLLHLRAVPASPRAPQQVRTKRVCLCVCVQICPSEKVHSAYLMYTSVVLEVYDFILNKTFSLLKVFLSIKSYT